MEPLTVLRVTIWLAEPTELDALFACSWPLKVILPLVVEAVRERSFASFSSTCTDPLIDPASNEASFCNKTFALMLPLTERSLLLGATTFCSCRDPLVLFTSTLRELSIDPLLIAPLTEERRRSLSACISKTSTFPLVLLSLICCPDKAFITRTLPLILDTSSVFSCAVGSTMTRFVGL